MSLDAELNHPGSNLCGNAVALQKLLLQAHALLSIHQLIND